MQFTDEDDGIKLLIGLSAADSDIHMLALFRRVKLKLTREEDVSSGVISCETKRAMDIGSLVHNYSLPLQDIICKHKSASVKSALWGFLTAMVIPNIGAFIARVLSSHYLFQPDGCQMVISPKLSAR